MADEKADIIGLYAIAREELDGVKEAHQKLERAILRLEATRQNLDETAKSGFKAVFSDAKNEIMVSVRQGTQNAASELGDAVNSASSRLSRYDWQARVLCFMFGGIAGGCVIFWGVFLMLEGIHKNQLYLMDQILIVQKSLKPKVARRHSPPTKSKAVGQAASGSAGEEEESKE